MIEDIYRDAVEVDLDGGSAVVVKRGSGPPVLLLHGIPLSVLTWRHNIGPLSESCTVYAVDMRGYGRSDKPRDADYSVPGLARFVRDLVDRLELPKVSMVGSSFGCAVAITFADMFPERADKLVLINPVCYPQGPHSVIRYARMGLVGALAGSALRTTTLGRRMMKGPLRRSYADPGLATPQLVATHHDLLVRDAGERTYLSTLRSLDEKELETRVTRLNHDAMVIWGEQDHVLPPTHSARLAEELQDARLELLPHAGHFPHEEDPERVNRLIATFLAVDDAAQPHQSTAR